jgi:hypothetical protein
VRGTTFACLLLLAVAAAGEPSVAAAPGGRAERPVWAFFVPAADGSVDVEAAARDAALVTGARLRHVSRWLGAASFDAGPAQEARLAALPQVRRTQPVARARRPEPVEVRRLDPSAWSDKAAAGDLDYGPALGGMAQAGVTAAHATGLSGRGVTVGLLDTGFAVDHEVFAGLEVVGAWDFVDDDPVVHDEEGQAVGLQSHGTMVLSVLTARLPGHLLGSAPGIRVLLARTEDVSQEVPAEEDHWVAGLEWLEAQGADIVSSSLGYLDWYLPEDLDGDTAVTTIAADMAAARGLVIVNSAGNSRNTTGTLGAPADGDSVIAVGAATLASGVAWFSSPGPTADGRTKPDVSALGVNNPVADPYDPFGYLAVSGTSLAAPLTAGVAALVLERVPGLDPMQVREALRETASQAAAPDNDLGWGIIDALAAANYWGPVFDHAPLADTEDTAGPYTVAAQVTARVGADPASLRVAWRADGGSWQDASLVPTGGGPVSYVASLPGQPAGTIVEYYLAGADLAGLSAAAPPAGPGGAHAFVVGPDLEAPHLAHAPPLRSTLTAWPPTIRCTAADNLGLAGVGLAWSLNGGPTQGPAALVDEGDGAWSLPFPVAAGDLVPGDVLSYTLTATDLSAAANSATAGPFALAVAALAQADTALTDAAGQIIPDGTASGLVRMQFLEAAASTIVEASVSIAVSHDAPEQLRISLYPPDGQAIVLHDHGGAGTADLVGTWPLDLVGRDANGVWILESVDDVAGTFGFLQQWSLALTLTPGVSPVGDVPAAAGLAAAPNPFNPRTVLVFGLERPARAGLAIYDIRGMLVRRLLDAELPAGVHEAAWDGRDDRGRAVASGVYLARLEAGGLVQQHKLTLVR